MAAIAGDVFAGVRGFWTTASTLAGYSAPPPPPPRLLLSDGVNNTAVATGLSHLRVWIGYALPSVIFADFLIGAVLVMTAFFLGLFILGDCKRLGCTLFRLIFLVIMLVAVLFWTWSIWQLSHSEFADTYTTIGTWPVRILAMIGLGVRQE
jgi:ABC-type multidrug transport system permease subunit